MAGLLVDMPTLWEIFLYNTVFRELVGSQNGYKQEEHTILEGKRSVRPDFLLFENMPDEKRIVLDAKYKKVWGDVYKYKPNPWYDETREDVLQAIAYMHLFRCKTGGVIFPVCDKEASRKAFEEASEDDAYYKMLRLYKDLPGDKPGDKFPLIPYFIPDQADTPSSTPS